MSPDFLRTGWHTVASHNSPPLNLTHWLWCSDREVSGVTAPGLRGSGGTFSRWKKLFS